MIKELFTDVSRNYFVEKANFLNDPVRPRKLSVYRSFQIIEKELRDLLQNESKIPYSQYLFEGSIGAGAFADVPWICVFDKEITKSAQDGFYLVFLFQANMEGVYLSLNQGCTQYYREYGTRVGRENIKANASKCQKVLRSIGNYNTEAIVLFSSSDLGKGYEAGNICSKYYSFTDFPADSELINDLRNFIGLYRELKGLVGSDILDIRAQVNEEEFQEEIQTGKPKDLPVGKIEKKAKRLNASSTSWVRDPNIAFMALKKANYKCENNENHITFISATNRHQFVEAHHLIPMEFQDDFDASIDVPENIISLCPNCHRAFHNAIDEVKIALAMKFLSQRNQQLEQRGISIKENKLIEYYKIEAQLELHSLEDNLLYQ
ncbi:MrcB family domain-containing protein [Adhaeribacter rhizoryzae]|uniref:DUF3578 domain-containing protein n=1 Tax=Adhaeribacter rhizoryzae TaxID=2607907 RepID=A0A5M6CZZ1_9BACT|nr:DUF3578 domain-containing protein [Adhaeribacter rhizoryzae]KAA5538859.1 DUF3578 domain-containing protein [Adhaeribacter rhizoryzae]